MIPADIFAEMPQQVDPKKLGKLRATFQFKLSGEDGGNWLVSIADGVCTVTQEEIAKPDVTISLSAADFVKMVQGQAQPLILFTQGKLKLQGDMNLAMKLQEVFAGASR
mgnify:CR=1 FL=1